MVDAVSKRLPDVVSGPDGKTAMTDLSPTAVALLLKLHDSATGRRSSGRPVADPAAVDELRTDGLAVRLPVGLCLTPLGVDQARRAKGDMPKPINGNLLRVKNQFSEGIV